MDGESSFNEVLYFWKAVQIDVTSLVGCRRIASGQGSHTSNSTVLGHLRQIPGHQNTFKSLHLGSFCQQRRDQHQSNFKNRGEAGLGREAFAEQAGVLGNGQHLHSNEDSSVYEAFRNVSVHNVLVECLSGFQRS